jgi:Ca2+-binding EF-hand superfamily protein
VCLWLFQIWNQYISTLGDKSESINEAKFIQAMSVMVKDPSQKERIAGPLPLFFQAVDANGDDFIDSSEFGIFFKIFGLDEKMAPASFQAIDTNNDGLLSKEEFITAGTDFFTSEDAACPTKLFWGPLV